MINPEPIQQAAAPTGRGGRWSGHPNIDGPVPPTEPYQPKPRTRPAGWPKTGTVGASATLGSDEEPVTVPARPYAGWDRPLVSEEVYVPCRFDDETCVGQITADRLCDVHRFGPPPAAELRAMANDLNAHGGLDETFVAELLRQAADPLADAKRGLGIVDPPLPVTTTEPLPSFAEIIAKACDDALRVPSPAPIVVHPDDYEMFKDLMTPRPTPITYAEIIALFARMSQPLPFATVKLTQAQIDAFPATRFAAPSVEPQHFFGTPVEIVDTVEESTPYQLTAKPGGIIEIGTNLTDAEFARLRNDWLHAVERGPVPFGLFSDGTPPRTFREPAPPEPDWATFEKPGRVAGPPGPTRPGWLARALRRLFT